MSEMPLDGAVPQWTREDRLQKALDHSRISVQAMADYLDLNRNTVGNYLAGRTKIPTAALRLWAMRCGVSYRWLKDGVGLDPSESQPENLLPRPDSNREPAGYEGRNVEELDAA